MARVFLSHASADKQVVRRIAEALRTAGHEPWLDDDEILAGESIPAAVEHGLRQADFVVLCLSKAAAERGWVEAERDAVIMQQFKERKERVLPVRLEDVAPPLLMAARKYEDLFPDGQAFEQGLARLMSAIAVHEARWARPNGGGAASGRPVVGSRPVDELSASLSVRDLVTAELATWGGRHVWGNVSRERWRRDEAIPFLPLDEIYVEPYGAHVVDGKTQPNEPVLALVQRLTAAMAEPQIVIITGDFGSGKSLTARVLVRRWAEERSKSPVLSLDRPLPIHVRCADDFPSEKVDLELTVRRAWKRQADSIGHPVSVDEVSFAWPLAEERVLCLLDGLDEVALSARHLQTFFQRLRDKTTRNHRFVIFSRPGALPTHQDLGHKVVVIQLQPFTSQQVEQWLTRWSNLHPDAPPINLEDVAHRDLATIVQTPILLFLVAFTWGQATASVWPPSPAELYEKFFQQIASGKASVDREKHGPISSASQRLLNALRDAHIVDRAATPADAMLWLMGCIAWEAHKLERYEVEPLTRERIDSLFRRGEITLPLDAIDIILDGLILTLQVNLYGASHIILFGHRSFREFLVGRYWAMALQRIIRCELSDSKANELLFGGRLLGNEDRSLDYLVQFIKSNEGLSVPASPLCWSNDERERLVRWAQKTFEDDGQTFTEQPPRPLHTSVRDDQRAVLREAALAIGSLTHGSLGIRANNPLALRSMLAWFWLTRSTAIVIAPGMYLAGAHLHEANLVGAILRSANLCKANLVGTSLLRADLRSANLAEAILHSADLGEARLEGAKLDGAELQCANLREANLQGASLQSASLYRAKLDSAALIGADLRYATLQEATLVEARLNGAKLNCANLDRANVAGANLAGADLREARLAGANLAGVDLRGANLAGANLVGADLRAANFAGADLTGADLRDASLHGATRDHTTVWPADFDASGIGLSESAEEA